MGESLYGKFGIATVTSGFIILIIAFFVSMTLGWLMPVIVIILLALGLIINIGGIILGIVGIKKDDLRENAIRALIAGIIFLIVGILLIILNIYIRALIG